MWKRVSDKIRSGYSNEEQRRMLMFGLLNLLLGAVAAIMTIVNIQTREYELMCVTGLFALLCLFNCLIIRYKWMKTQVAVTLFTIEAMVLLVYFVLSGIPGGFSVLWTLLVPSISLYVFTRKIGIRFSILTLLMVVFFFWTPFGRSLLYYQYSQVFMLRFPFVYVCLFLAALYIDIIRVGVYNKLKETEERARYLYRHDALTGIFNRHAFYEELGHIYNTPSGDRVTAVIFDIDDFKVFNDLYGHNTGDELLKSVARIIQGNICEHCIACRWGGEEFLVLMRCQHDPFQMAEQIRKIAGETAVECDSHLLHITLSAGIATADTLDKSQLSSFINCADQAMYASKQEGKNKTTCVQFIPK